MASPEQLQRLLDRPALRPPPGENMDQMNPETQLRLYLVTLILCVSTSTIVLFMRMYVKVLHIKKVGWEDVTCVLGWLMFIGYLISSGFAVQSGAGTHQWDISLRDFFGILYYVYISSAIYGLAIMVLKVSIIIQYKTILVPSSRRSEMWWGSYGLMAVVVTFQFIITFIQIFQCNPREKAWNRLIQTGTCIDSNQINVSSAVFNSATDFGVLILPQRVIWKLQMPLKRKLAVSGIFLLGFFACVTSILRLVYAIRLGHTEDISWHITEMGYWTYAEFSVGIICACLPTLPKAFQQSAVFWAKCSPSNWTSGSHRLPGSWWQICRKTSTFRLNQSDIVDAEQAVTIKA